MNKIISFGILSIFLISMAIPATFAQRPSISQTESPKAIVTEGKYLTISDNRFRNSGQTTETTLITGDVINNSTEEISDITIHAALFDQNDKFVDIVKGSPLVSTLPPGDDSPFSISISPYLGINEGEVIGSYILFASGSPTESP